MVIRYKETGFLCSTNIINGIKNTIIGQHCQQNIYIWDVNSIEGVLFSLPEYPMQYSTSPL